MSPALTIAVEKNVFFKISGDQAEPSAARVLSLLFPAHPIPSPPHPPKKVEGPNPAFVETDVTLSLVSIFFLGRLLFWAAGSIF